MLIAALTTKTSGKLYKLLMVMHSNTMFLVIQIVLVVVLTAAVVALLRHQLSP
jgi:hypothetical protein